MAEELQTQGRKRKHIEEIQKPSNTVSQVESYFRRTNLPRFWHLISENDDGMVLLERICSRTEMRKLLGLTKNAEVSEEIVRGVADELRTSDLVVVSEDGKKVGSKIEYAKLKEVIEEIDNRTVAASSILLKVKRKDLEAFFSAFGEVKRVFLPSLAPGTAFVEFSTKEEAEKLLKQPSLSYRDVCLELKPKKDFVAETGEKKEQAQGERKEVEEGSKVKKRFSLFNRPYRKVVRLESCRSSLPILPLLQIEKYRIPLDLQACGDGRVPFGKPIFGIRWCIPEFDYLVDSHIQAKKKLPLEEFSRLKLHFMTLEHGSQTLRNQAALPPSNWDRLKTSYLSHILNMEQPNLNQPQSHADHHADRFDKHLSEQNHLDQQHAIELMLSCHDRFQMARLLDDMRGKAHDFATRENCYIDVAPTPEGHPGRLQMYVHDLVTLVRDLLGPSFHPKIIARSVGEYLVIHEISVYVDEDGRPVYCHKNYSNCDLDRLTIF